jgi:hypothetical protein
MTSLSHELSSKKKDKGCRVLGCKESIPELTYFKRYKICKTHASCLAIAADLIDNKKNTNDNNNTSTACMHCRWCQQCARFHSCNYFDGDKKSCITSLLRVKQKRRLRITKQHQGGSTGNPPMERMVATAPSSIDALVKNYIEQVPPLFVKKKEIVNV